MKLKLSELADDIEISAEDSGILYTVAELKNEIVELGEPHHERANWYTAKRQKWTPSAQYMVEMFIENEYENMYEDWDERAWNCVMNQGTVEKIQAILDETFNSDHATAYWTHEEPVEIDIFPN